MAWSYSGDPTSSPKDEIRFLIGDTDEADPVLQDGEILYVLDEHGGSVPRAAIAACEAAIAKLARSADMSSGVTSVSLSQRRQGMEALLSQLKRQVARRPQILVGGSEPPRFQRGDDKYGRP